MPFVVDKKNHKIVNEDSGATFRTAGSNSEFDLFELTLNDQTVKITATHSYGAEKTSSGARDVCWKIIAVTVPKGLSGRFSEILGMIQEALETLGVGYNTRHLVKTVTVVFSQHLLDIAEAADSKKVY